MRALLVLVGVAGAAAGATATATASPGPTATESAESSRLDKERLAPIERAHVPGKRKLCCGYPLAEERGFALRFYWLAKQERHAHHFDEVDVYTRHGFFLGVYSASFLRELRMEGSGLLEDGRVINWDGRCSYGAGTCFEQLDPRTHPYGRGAGRRPLVPFKSVAVDPRLIPIGEPLYIPEFDGMPLPGGQVHDGCVRADDTGGNIKQRKMDFFVKTRANFRYLLGHVFGGTWITPHIEEPRCEYLRGD